MQIRLGELRRIISEEVRNIVEISDDDADDAQQSDFNAFKQALTAKLDGTLPFEQAHKAMMKVFYTLSPADKRKAKALLKRSTGNS